METIHKFSLNASILQTIKLPKGSEILSVQSQHDKPTVWAQISDTALPYNTSHHFCTAITGGNVKIPPAFRFLDTVQMHKGQLVLHVFHKVEEEK